MLFGDFVENLVRMDWVMVLTAIGLANMICAEMGLDPIAAGGTVATAMELTAKGLDSKDALRLDLKFGQSDDLLQALSLMATKKGHAKRIGQGAKAIAEEFGKPELFMGGSTFTKPVAVPLSKARSRLMASRMPK